MNFFYKYLIAAFFISISGTNYSQSLPKGKKTQIDRNKARAPKNNQTAPKTVCDTTKILSPIGGHTHFSSDGKKFYIAAIEDTIIPKNKNRVIQYKYVIHEFQTQTLKSKPLIFLNQIRDAHLLTNSNPIKWIGMAAHYTKYKQCESGLGRLINLNINKSIKPTKFTKFNFRVVKSTHGRMLVDLSTGYIIDIDSSTSQQRKIVKIAPQEVPLFLANDSDELITYAADKKFVKYYKNFNLKGFEKLTLKESEHIILDNNKLAVVTKDLPGNTLTVSYLKNWTWENDNREFKLKIPSAYRVSEAELIANFKSHTLIVSPKSRISKQRWQRAFVFRKTENEFKLSNTIEVKNNKIINAINISPDGKYVLAEESDATNRKSLNLRVFDMLTQNEELVPFAK